ncbi:hypothetical protein [Spirosoma gilvum]
MPAYEGSKYVDYSREPVAQVEVNRLRFAPKVSKGLPVRQLTRW